MSIGRKLQPVFFAISGLFFLSFCHLQRFIENIDDLSSPRNELGNSFLRHQRHLSRRHRTIPQSPPNPIQHHHQTHSASLLEKYNDVLNESEIEATVSKMRSPVADRLETVDESRLTYNIHRCPEVIPEGYPVQWNVKDVLSNWNPDDTDIPSKIYQGLCILDWKDPQQQRLAEIYRHAEVPFVLHNHPQIWKTAERWSHYDYLHDLLGGNDNTYRNEHSQNNHMPYWKLDRNKGPPKGWVPPTENVELSFPDWYAKAKTLEDPNRRLGNNSTSTTITTTTTTNEKEGITNAEHWYFRLNGIIGGQNEFLYDELPMFAPIPNNFFMPEPDQQRGINCRFGSKGIIAETHYDFSRNFIIILQGQKRYILAHPNQCPNLELYQPGHPSARHSKVDWSDPNDWNMGRFPQAQVNEVVLQAGDALYLPTAWFHFIVSLNLNYQCNARSGITFENQKVLTECGF